VLDVGFTEVVTRKSLRSSGDRPVLEGRTTQTIWFRKPNHVVGIK